MLHRKTKIILVQLGSPASPKTGDVRKYLKEFLADPRVVDMNPLAWKLILNFFVLPFRPRQSGRLYSRIWNGDSFPLIDITRDFTLKVSTFLPDKEKVEVNHAFLLSDPRVSTVWDNWEKDLANDNSPATKFILIPMFPQYSESTIASGMDAFARELEKRVKIPPYEFVTNFHTTKAFIDNSVTQINESLEKLKVDKLILSFHGIPKRRVLYKGDDYFKHCCETFYLLKRGIKNVEAKNIEMTFQSRFGSEEWLTPYTDKRVCELIKGGDKSIAVYCPAFVADCLETIDEIGTELQEEARGLGGKIHFIPCLNDNESWCRDFATYIHTLSEGNYSEQEELKYSIPKEVYEEIPVQEMKSPPLSPKAKTSLRIVFLTLFLDLIGFSIIFPLFPQLAKYYLEVDSDNFFLRLIFDSITQLTSVSGAGVGVTSIVLFGGALGALYSFLQFIAAPLWGTVSDRIGRKPVLLISVFFLAISYVLWFFSGSFTLLIVARFIGGIMGGNISTATAVVADVTEKSNRSKGMATIGIAFAFGFIIGPALGGGLSLINLLDYYPNLAEFGVNPFSLPAGIAAILSFINFYYLCRKFEETLPPEKRGDHASERTVNIFKMLKPLPYPGVNLTNVGHFLFLMAFSGMEFTLTFLAFERLSFSPMDNAWMFVFIGFILALVQGGIVRRKASEVGEKKMVIMGLISIIPGLLLIGFATSVSSLYFGLFFLAVGSAMTIPCLTTLVSQYTPATEQGRSVGIFRSLGALARVIGPIAASVIYWKMGSSYPYFIGAGFLLLPIILIGMLPKVKE